jgi:hypothetical protein
VAKAESVVAARLLRALAIRSRTTEAALPLTTHWPGAQNHHADTAYQSTSKFHSGPNRGESCADDCSFLTLFRSTFYLPQKASWQLQRVPEHQLSLLISTLRGQKLPMQQWMFNPANATGKSGQPTAPTSDTATHSSRTSKQQSGFKCSWESLPTAVQAFGVEAAKSEPIQLQSRFGTSAGPTSWLDIPAHASPDGEVWTCT